MQTDSSIMEGSQSLVGEGKGIAGSGREEVSLNLMLARERKSFFALMRVRGTGGSIATYR